MEIVFRIGMVSTLIYLSLSIKSGEATLHTGNNPKNKWKMPEAGQGDKVAMRPSCALSRMQSCCNGKGYIMGSFGANAHAELCGCVKSCPACHGQTSYIEGNTSRSCREPSPKTVVNSINNANIPARFAASTLKTFENYTGNAREVIPKISAWKDGFNPVKSKGLLLSGPVGVGKTFLLAALAMEFAESGLTVHFTDFFQLLADIRAGFEKNKAEASILNPLIDVDVLFIDELGKGRNRDFDKTIIDQLICGRYNQKKTVITSTNYTLKADGKSHHYNVDLERENATKSDFESDVFGPLETRLGTRIYSRLREMTNFVELTGDDFRRQMGV